MGIFDKIFGKDAKEAEKSLNKLADMLIKAGFEPDKKKEEKKPEEPVKPAAPEPVEEEEQEYQYKVVTLIKNRREKVAVEANAAGSDLNHGTVDYIKDVIGKNFPGLEFRTEVPVSELTADVPEKAMNVSLMVSKGGKAVLAVFMVEKGKYRTHRVLNSMNICEKAGIPALRFMKEFENKPGYVTGRVRKYIG